MSAPEFLCIGAQKAGTSWLYAMLRQHGEVFLPPMKEIHFFDFIYIPSHRKWIRGSFKKSLRKLRRDATWGPYMAQLAEMPRRDDDWYAAVFAHPAAEGRVRGEITPAYSLLPSRGIDRVRAVNPDMKIILIIRDPVDRALSHLRMAAERRDWDSVNADRIEEAGILPAVLARSSYRENIARWEAVFPAGQILYLPYAQIRSAPEAFLRRAEDFLGIGAHDYRNLGDSVHKTRPVAVAPDLAGALAHQLQGERDWLAGRFGAAFAH